MRKIKAILGSIFIALVLGSLLVISAKSDVAGNWQPITSHTTGTLRAIFWRTPEDGWIVGDNGRLLQVDLLALSPDTVATVKNTGVSANLYGVSFPERAYGVDGWAVGDGGTILHTADKGNSWGTQASGTTANLRAVAMADKYRGWAVGQENTILRSVDGMHWNGQNSGLSSADFSAVQALDLYHAWVAGRDNSDQKPVILHTTDGGSHWQLAYRGEISRTLRALYFSDAQHGWAVGTNGLILQTTDGGANWLQHSIAGLSTTLTAVWSSDDGGDIWVAGENHLIEHSGDGGATWAAETTGINADFNGLQSFNAYGGSGAVGSNGTFLLRQALTRTVSAYFVSRPPVIDGHLDEWQNVPAMPLNYRTAEAVRWHETHYRYQDSLQDANIGLRAGWDNDHLYFSVVITDDIIKEDDVPAKPWYDDEIELGIDGGKRFVLDDGYPNSFDHQYTVNPSEYFTDWGYINAERNPRPPITVATVRTTHGWNIEVSVPYSEVQAIPLYAGRVFGFTFGYHDDDGGGGGGWDTYYIWEGSSTNDTFGQFHGYGNLALSHTLLPGMPTPTPTPTETPSPTPTVGSIRAVAWIDANSDGVHDEGELPLPNAFVRFLQNGSQLVDNGYTDASGVYTATNLASGLYIVTESNPPGYQATTAQSQSVFLHGGQTEERYFGAAPVATATPTETLTPTATPTSSQQMIYLPICWCKG